MKAFLIILFLLPSIALRAQTWDEFFRQKKTQKKYLLKQIAALKMYGYFLSTGYKIADKGLKTIKGFTNGEFDLHSLFFRSLETLNPAIKRSQKLRDIVSWQAAIIRDYNSSITLQNTSPDDRSYFKSVKDKVLSDCRKDLDELILLVTNKDLEMKDDERIERIDILHEKMLDKYQFTKTFVSKVQLLNLQQEKEKRDIETTEGLYRTTN